MKKFSTTEKTTENREKSMINTYNETKLHKTLKEIYAMKHDGARTEVTCGKYIADILLEDGGIIEIQTGTLASLAPKIAYFLAEKRKILYKDVPFLNNQGLVRIFRCSCV